MLSSEYGKRSRGCAPTRRLTLLSCHKRVSRKGHPNSLPCGFPLFRYALQLRKKLAKAQTFFLETLQSSTTLRLRHTGNGGSQQNRDSHQRNLVRISGIKTCSESKKPLYLSPDDNKGENNPLGVFDLETLLNLDGEIFPMENGCWTKFEAYQVEPSKQLPHGISYSLTFHDRNN